MDRKIYTILFAIVFALGLAAVFIFGGGGEVPKKELVAGDTWVKGNKDAKVQLVEFSDFQCPACGMAQPVLKQVLDFYGPDKVALYYRHFPLPQHKSGVDSAKAAEAAGKQGKFWQMHDLLFVNQSKLAPGIFEQLAKELELDPVQFKADFTAKETLDRVNADKKDGETLGVNSTPTFYLNGEKVDGGGLTLEDWKKLIDKKLNE